MSIHRPTLLVALAVVVSACAATPRTVHSPEPRMQQPPRKMIVGAVVHGFWGEYPGLEPRITQLIDLIDRVHAAAQDKYQSNADLVVLPEEALTYGRRGTAQQRSLVFGDDLKARFAAVARKYDCYLVLPLDLMEDESTGACYNAAILFDRAGEIHGVYRKVHMVLDTQTLVPEGGMTRTWDVPVFDCDFGRLGIQICWDMTFDHNWQVLEDQGADLVVWPTAAPNTVRPRHRARTHGYYIVSSTFRGNAAVFEPTGVLAAQVASPEHSLVQRIDLSYAVIGWSPKLRDGKAFTDKFGDRIAYRYHPREDCGIFWSNDPGLPIGQAVDQLGLTPLRRFEADAQSTYRNLRRQAGR